VRVKYISKGQIDIKVSFSLNHWRHL